MKKLSFFFAALLCAMSISAKTFYLQPSDNWLQGSARFALYAFDSSSNTWQDMTAVSGETNLYSATIDDKYTTVIFCRMNGATTTNSWDNKWNQTQDMTVQADKNLCVIGSEWDKDGSWSTYSSTPAEPTETVFKNGESQFYFVVKGIDFGGVAWNESDPTTMNVRYKLDGTAAPYTREFTSLSIPAGTMEYQLIGRVTSSNTYTYYPSKTTYLKQSLSAEVEKLAVSFDPADPAKVSVTPTYKTVVADPELYFIGDLATNSWATDKGDKFTYDADKKLFTLPIKATATHYFSLASKLTATANDWDGLLPNRYGAPTDGYTTALNTAVALTAANGNAFIGPIGEYTITVDLEKLTLTLVSEGSVTPEPEPASELYFIGDLATNSWATDKGDKFTYDADKKLFTLPIKATATHYFSLASKLTATANDWDGLLPNRYGAPTDGYTTALNTAVALTAANGNAFIGPIGEYTITVDLEKLTLTLVSEGSVTPEPELKEYTVSLYNPGWDKVMAYIWNSPKYNSTKWEEAAELTKDEDGWYKATIQEGGNIIFRSETEQTVDIENVKADVCYQLDEKNAEGKYTLKVNAECKVEESEPEYQYLKVEGELKDWTGQYLIVYEDGALAYNGAGASGTAAGNLNGAANGVAVTISGKVIAANEQTDAINFTVTNSENEGKFNIRSASGLNIGNSTGANVLMNATTKYDITLTYDSEAATTYLQGTGTNVLRYNAATGSTGQRFRFYAKTNQKPIQLYKRVKKGETLQYVGQETETPKLYLGGAVTEFGWDPSNGVELTYDEEKAVYTTSFTVKAGDYFYFTEKLASSSSAWDEIKDYRYGATDNAPIVVAGTAYKMTKGSDAALTAAAAEYSAVVDLQAATVLLTQTGVIPIDESKYYLAGDKPLTGYNWNLEEEWLNNELTVAEGVATISLENITLAAATDYGFKVVEAAADYIWYGNDQGGNVVINVEKSGIYNITITFNTTTHAISFTATLVKEEEVTDTYVVAGNFLTPVWDATAVANQMTVADGVATLVLENVELLVSGDYQYKVVKNGSVWMPESNLTLSVEKDGLYDVTFTLVLATQEISAVATLKEEIIVLTGYALLVNNETVQLAPNGENEYKLENYDFAAGDKIQIYSYETQATFSANTNSEDIKPVEGVITVINAGNYSLYLVLSLEGDMIYVVKNGTTPIDESKYYLAGDKPLTGYNWNLEEEWLNNELTVAEGVATISLENITLAAATDYGFKVVEAAADYIWYGNDQGGNVVINVEKSGIYNITITFNTTTHAISFTATLVKEEEVTDTYVVAGNFLTPVWDATAVANQMTVADGVATLVLENVELLVSGDYQYKVVKNGSVWMPESNLTLSVEKDGLYDVTFTLVLATQEISAVATLKEEIIVLTGYALLVNNETVQLAPNGENEYKLENYDFAAGDKIQIYSYETQATFSANTNSEDIKPVEGVITVINAGNYSLYLVLSLEGDMIYVVKNGTTPIDEHKYVVAGVIVNGATWQPDGIDNLMTLNTESGLYELTIKEVLLESGINYEYKICTDGLWPAGENQVFSVTQSAYYDVLYTYNPATLASNVVTTKVKDIDIVIEHTYTVAGVSDIVNGDDSWSATNTANDMTLDNGLYTLVVTDVYLTVERAYSENPNDQYKFKVVVDHSWNVSYPSQDWVIYDVEADGVYTITYTFNAETKEVMATWVKTGDIDTALDDVQTLDTNAPMFNILGQRVDDSYRGIVIQNGQKYLLK